MREARIRRHKRVRKKVLGTSARPRLSVYRSLTNMYVQLIDDENEKTLISCSTRDADFKAEAKRGNVQAAERLGGLVAVKAKEKGIEKVVFDRGGVKFHGRVKALAEAARKGGLLF